MTAPVSAGTLKRSVRQEQHPKNSCQGSRQRRNNDERIKPGLEVDHDQQIYKHDRHHQSNEQALVRRSHGLNLADYIHLCAARQVIAESSQHLLQYPKRRHPDRVRPSWRKHPPQATRCNASPPQGVMVGITVARLASTCRRRSRAGADRGIHQSLKRVHLVLRGHDRQGDS